MLYSPGLVCPHGWTTASQFVRSEAQSETYPPYTLTGSERTIWSWLKQSETFLQCCPSGYETAGAFNDCLSPISKDALVIVTTYDKACKSSAVVSATATASSRVGCPAVNLIIPRGGTVAIEDTPAETGSGSNEPGDGHSHSQSSASSTSHGLSNSAKIGIGVAIPLVVLIAAGVFAWFFLGYRRRRHQSQTASSANNHPNVAEIGGSAEKQYTTELDGSKPAALELGATKPAVLELEAADDYQLHQNMQSTVPSHIAELSGTCLPSNTVAEPHGSHEMAADTQHQPESTLAGTNTTSIGEMMESRTTSPPLEPDRLTQLREQRERIQRELWDNQAEIDQAEQQHRQ